VTQIHSSNGLCSIFKFSEILGSTSHCVVLFEFFTNFVIKVIFLWDNGFFVS